MNAPTEFDTSPLSWVKNEIDLALERAANALNAYAESIAAGAIDLSHIQYCRTHLHQVQGALTIIGLDGVRQLAEALEALLEAMESGVAAPSEANIALIYEGLQGISGYLDALLAGQGNQPLRLFPLYAAVQQARGIANPSPSDLFFPDLGVRPPRRQRPVEEMAEEALQEHVRHERGRFQRGLLAWLRDPRQKNGVADMLEAVKNIEATQDAASARAFWWVATALLTALAEGALPQEADAKQVCARIDLQIRRMIEGSKNVAERLMRDLLYLVAVCQSAHPAIEQIRQAYRLREALRVEDAPAVPAAHEPILHRLHEAIAAAEDAWNRFCAGTPQALPLFREYALAIAAFADQLERTDYRRLAQAILATANNLGEDPARHSDALAMEVATGLLLAQNAQENFSNLGQDFAHQVDITVARIHGCLAGAPPKADAEIPLLDEISRKAQDRLLIAQVAREIQGNLGQIEQTLDTFFRNTQTHGNLGKLEAIFRQTEGALTLLGHDGAARALHHSRQEAERFAQPDYAPQDEDFQRIAHELSLIGFYVDAIPGGANDFSAFVARMEKKPADAAHDGVYDSAYDAGEELEPLGGITVEQEVAQQKREAQHLLGALLEQPDDAGLREELRQNLTALKDDADLVADAALSQQADAALTALDEGAAAAPQIQEAIASLKTPGETTPQPSEATLQLSQASTEEIDAELLEIFLEEAREVLVAVGENTQRVRQHPSDVEALTTVRRAFHTLKGSGRMVGLKDLGETAWAIEQTLNLWLRQEEEVTFALVSLLEQAKLRFDEWVEYLASGSGAAPDVTALVDFAETLRHPEGSPAAPRAEAGAAPGAKPSETPAKPEQPAGASAKLQSTAITGFLDQYRAETAAADAEAAAEIAVDLPGDLPALTERSDESHESLAPATHEAAQPPAPAEPALSLAETGDAGTTDTPETAAGVAATPIEIGAPDDDATILPDPFETPITAGIEEVIEIPTMPLGDQGEFDIPFTHEPAATETPMTLDIPAAPLTPPPAAEPIELTPPVAPTAPHPHTPIFGLSAVSSTPAAKKPTETPAPVATEKTADAARIQPGAPQTPLMPPAPTHVTPVSYDENIARALARVRGARSAAPVAGSGATAVPAAPQASTPAPKPIEPKKVEPVSYTDILALAAAAKAAPEKAATAQAVATQVAPESASIAPVAPIKPLPQAPIAPAEPDALAAPQAERIQAPEIPDALLGIFREEASAHLATLYRELPRIERADAPATPHEMYRAAHTLAGIAATVGIDALYQLGHALENALLRRDASSQRDSLDAPGLVHQAVQAIDAMLNGLFNRRDIRRNAELLDALNALYPIDAAAPAPLAPESPRPESLADARLDENLADGDAEAIEVLEIVEPEVSLPAEQEAALPAGPEAIEPASAAPLAPAESAPPIQSAAPALIAPEAPRPESPADARLDEDLADGDAEAIEVLEIVEPEAIEPAFAAPPAPAETAPPIQSAPPAPIAPEPATPAPSPRPVPPVIPSAPEAPILSAAIAALPRRQDEIDEQLLPIFLEEAQDLTQRISEQLRIWREAPDDGQPAHLLARLLHTLKGSARMAGAMNLGEITHAIETRVQDASRTLPAAREVIVEIESVFDDVQQIIERLQRGETLESSPAAPTEAPAIAPTPIAPIMPAPVAPAAPAASAAARPERRAEPRPAELESRQATLRVRADLLDRLVNDAGELSIARTRIEGEMRSLKDSLLDLTESVIRLRRQLRDIEIQAETQMQSRNVLAESRHAGFDPLEFDRFTQFQEITRMMAESVNDVTTVQQNLLRNLDEANAALLAQSRINRTLQQELMSVRMVQAGSLSDRLYRITRQTAKELGKRVSLEITGSQVEIDRSVLEKIAAPLEHMLRNSISHGIETREARQAAGKAETGEISLTFRQEGNEVIVSLSDDGAGLNLKRIRERGIESGLIGADETPDEARLAQLILLPGFSTAAQVSQISGRGVGMDVVKSEITSLGGRIEISSESGKGTQFTLYIPLTLAVTKALLVRVGNRSYAIPSAMIEQVLDLKDAALDRAREAGQTQWQGETYPLAFLAHLLGDARATPEERRQSWVLLLHSGARRIAVQVDELQGNHEVVVKNIGAQLARVVGIDGATVLGDGQVVLIINPVALSARTPIARPSAAPAGAGAAIQPLEAPHTPTVMVVDDSLTVRKITGRLLAREGYHVLTAKDGVDALEQLIDAMPDVMLVDIEMPRMDGFDLTRHIRADERLRHIPIIMITSRTAEKHRNYAFEIGVNHFLGKPYQEEELLAHIAQYAGQRRGGAATH